MRYLHLKLKSFVIFIILDQMLFSRVCIQNFEFGMITQNDFLLKVEGLFSGNLIIFGNRCTFVEGDVDTNPKCGF